MNPPPARTLRRRTLLTALAACAALGVRVPTVFGAPDWAKLGERYKKLGGKPADWQDWQTLLKRSADLPAADKLKRVNDFFNQKLQFIDDIAAWGAEDYWATPLETLAKGKGDCEDYVIAKYFSLLVLQIPNQHLRLIYVKARIGGAAAQAHMVLAWYAGPDAEPLILDNLISEIRPASRRNDLMPVFSFNSEGVYIGVEANAQAGPGGVARLSRWQELLQRVREQGFE